MENNFKFYKIYRLLCFLVFMISFMKDVISYPSQEIKSCYSDNNDPYPYTGIKTPYHYIHNRTEEYTNISNCKPLQIWLLCRHGTRYPNARTISKILNLTHIRDYILENHEIAKRGQLCDKDLEGLKNWKPDLGLDEKKAKYITEQGRKELASLGTRLKVRFPALFAANSSKDYKFRSTNSQRTIVSMESFINGAFGDVFTVNPELDDTLLKIYKNCEPWLRELNNSKANEQVESFINGPEMNKVIVDVSMRLGFTKKISKEDTFLFYNVCRFQKAWYLDKISPWCAAFTDDEMRVFEYEEDLYHYYHVGHGQKINSKLGCQLLRDMLHHFTKLENVKEDDEPKGIFYFTHSEMIMLFFTAMGIGKDIVPITAWNFRNMDRRNWKTSLLVPFATNFAAVFYRCDDSSFKIAFYLAENPLTLADCENGICDWIKLKKKLGVIAANCNTDFCQKES